MNRSALVLLTSLVTGLISTGCRKSEPDGSSPATGTDQKVEVAEVKEIKLGQVMPYSGPASAYGTIGRLHAAYFAKLNKEGGINGYKINLISLDDSYSPPKAVEQVRKLVEQEHVAAIFNPVGTPSNSAIHKYLNEKQVPQLFVATGAAKWNDPQHFPWTIGFNPSYVREGETYARHILKTNPKAKIAVLSQNDDFGKDVLAGLKTGLGDKAASMIVAEATYEVSDPTVDSQIVTLKGSKANVFVNIATPKFSAQTIRKVADLNWKVTQYVANVGASIGSVLIPAGVERAKGILTVAYFKDPSDKRFAGDPAILEWQAFMKSDFPDGNAKDASNVYAYLTATTLTQVLKQCAGDFSSANIMKQAASLKDYTPGLLLPGLTINTSANDFETFDKLELARFNGAEYEPAEPIM
jgi:branched-chain amino acid transport system substrate-binding protein